MSHSPRTRSLLGVLLCALFVVSGAFARGGESPQELLERAARTGLPVGQLLEQLLESSEDPRAALEVTLDRSPSLLAFDELAVACAERIARGDLSPTAWERCVTTAHTLLASLGQAADVDRLLTLSAPLTSGQRLPQPVERSLEECLGSIFDRDPASYEQVVPRFTSRPDGVLPPVVRALGASVRPEALTTLLRLHGKVDWIDASILSRAAHLARNLVFEGPEPLIHGLRDGLDGERSAQILRERVLCLAALQDHDSVPSLLPLLGHENEGVRECAWHALKQLTGLGLRKDAATWKHWHEGEVRWWNSNSHEVLKNLRSPNGGRQLQGVRALGQRRAPYRELVEELTWALENGTAPAASLAAQHLGRMGARSAVPVLERMLTHSDTGVATACGRALQDLGSSPPTR